MQIQDLALLKKYENSVTNLSYISSSWTKH